VPILGLTKVTMKRLAEDSREYTNLAAILQAGERARDLVRQILAFSRKEAPTRLRVDLAPRCAIRSR
jgi:two-component system cell cycle sensor histidine kinase/response regulator CckA